MTPNDHPAPDPTAVPALSVPGQVTRRRFLQGALAGAGTLTFLPTWMDGIAAAATPVAATEGILVVLHLGGGNDGLNTVVPVGSSAYTSLRGPLALTSPQRLAGVASAGLHPALAKLRARYDAGKVAIVRGVGQTTNDLSHFTSTATWMAGTTGSSRTTGWLGRWLDGVPESTAGLRAVTIGSSIPLHLQGQQALVTALDTGGDLFGADRSEPWMGPVYDTVAGFGSGPTGKGQWADRIAGAGKASVGLAGTLTPVFEPAFPDTSLRSQLTLVARLVNANLGIRVFNVSFGSFDTHEDQLSQHQDLMADLDAAIDAFYATLQATWGRRVTLMTFSEFGRRVEANASDGTDHGAASALFVIGENVRGGMYGAAPSLTDLDDRGDLRVAVDFRSVYASVLGGWLGGDPAALLGGSYEDLKLFAATPGLTPVPPVTVGPWVPFATATDLVRQQYLDLLGRVGDPTGVAGWAAKLVAGTRTIPQVIDAFLHAPEFGRAVAPAARMALAGLGGPPAFDDLMAWGAQIRAGTPAATVAASIATRPAFGSRFGGLSNASAVTALFREVLGRAPTASEAATWTNALVAGTATRAGLLADLAARSEAITRYRARVEVLMTYAGLLRRTPDAGGWTFWVAKVEGGTSIQQLIARFFGSAEYRRRFA